MSYITWDPNNSSGDVTLSNGNLTASTTESFFRRTKATEGRSSGKYYWEIVNTGNGNFHGIGNASALVSTNNYIGSDVNTWGYYAFNGNRYTGGSGAAYGAGLSTNDVLGVALDLDNGAIWFSVNGAWQGSATIGEIEAGTTTNAAYTGLSGELFPMAAPGNSSFPVTARFDPASFSTAAPSGFQALTGPVTGSVDVALTVAGAARIARRTATGTISIPLTLSGNAELPTIRASGSVSAALSLTGAANLPNRRATGSISFGMSLQGAAVVRTPIVGTSSVSVSMTISSSGYVTHGAFDAGMSGPESSMDGVVGFFGQINAGSPGPEGELTGFMGLDGAIDSTIDGPEAELSGVQGFVGAIDSELGVLGGSLFGYMAITGSIDTEAMVLGASLFGTVEFEEVWHVVAMNLENGAITEYESYQYNSIMEWNGSYYGATDTGIFLLDGADDNGANISAYAVTGVSDHKSEKQKRVNEAYVSGKSISDMTFSVIVDESQQYDYPVPMKSTYDAMKVSTGRGIKARYLQYRIANTGGADFDCDGFDVMVNALEKRKR